ncbi:MAG: SpoIIE family protein phosphatase [Planctomycetes bacterium]|nr:SpoIIE family protein phosphatase [Planctomycetota bacterium]
MFFRRKKEPPKAPAPEARPAPSVGAPPAPPARADSTAFLTGDDGLDRRTIEILLRGIAQVTESRDLEPLLVDIVDTSIDVTGAERGLLILSDERSGLSVRVARARGKKPVEGQVRFSTSIVKRVLADLDPVRAQVSSDSEALELGTSVYDLKLRAVMCVPLVASEGPEGSAERGVLYVDSKAATREYSQKDLSLFAALSQYIRIALQNARLHIVSVEKARLEQSLEIAAQIQRDLMAETPGDVPGYDIHGWYRPAEGTTGDFYDFVKMKGGRHGVFVGDVSGHGIGPALIMAEAKSALRQGLKLLDDPAAIVRSVCEDLGPRMEDNLFLTLFVAVLAPDGTVKTLNAGHTPPLVWRARERKVEIIPGHAPAVGFVDDFPYEEGPRHALEPGDALVLLTDGLVEARSAEDPDVLFGEQRIQALLAQHAAAGLDAKGLVEALVAEVLRFAGGKRDDDMTLLVVRRSGG